MPSGAKKRKAAKKKKEIQSNNHTNSSSAAIHPHGDEDRESDVGENSSPTSQDHHNLPTREEEEIPIEREFKVEDELDERRGNGNGVRSKSPDNAPRATADTDNGAEHVKDSAVTQPLLAPPIPEKKTSWKSCCGLFELFSGSGE